MTTTMKRKETNIRVYSDIHQEFHRERILFDVPIQDNDSESILVLAGDIDYLKFGLLLAERMASRFKAVIYVPGNHEYYNSKHGKLGEEQNKIDK